MASTTNGGEDSGTKAPPPHPMSSIGGRVKAESDATNEMNNYKMNSIGSAEASPRGAPGTLFSRLSLSDQVSPCSGRVSGSNPNGVNPVSNDENNGDRENATERQKNTSIRED